MTLILNRKKGQLVLIQRNHVNRKELKLSSKRLNLLYQHTVLITQKVLMCLLNYLEMRTQTIRIKSSQHEPRSLSSSRQKDLFQDNYNLTSNLLLLRQGVSLRLRDFVQERSNHHRSVLNKAILHTISSQRSMVLLLIRLLEVLETRKYSW